MELTLGQLAALVQGKLPAADNANARPEAGPELVLTGFAALADAGKGDLSFFGNERYLPDLRRTKASAVLVPAGFPEEVTGVVLVEVENPSAAFAAVVQRFTPPQRVFVPGIHPTAVIDASVVMDREKVAVGPFVVIEAGVEIGDGTTVGAGSFVGEGVKIGRDCLLYPRATVYRHCVLGDRVALHSGVVIGSDGFGYEFSQGRHRKIDQVGIARIDSDVEIGANTTVDRARFGRTWIQEGVKIDNQVQIGHNCVIGKHAIIIAQAGIAGSSRIGDYTIIAAQAGVAGHLEIASQVVVAAQSGVTKSISAKGQYMGFPAAPVAEMRRQMAGIRKIGEVLKRLAALEKRTGGLEEAQKD
jgi:UDP-3-O-[3-hydroxymyristoyl] glucosamine N-acyltransferase